MSAIGALHWLDQVPRRLLVLHMDINRTILQVDPAGGKTVADVLNTNIAGRVFGRVDDDGSFQLLQGMFSAQDGEAPEGSVSYDEYIDNSIGSPPDMATASAAEKRAMWKTVTTKRREFLHRFTHPGSPGEAFAAHVPHQHRILEYSSDPRCRLIPSFFSLVNTLSDADWPFHLIFRTFGDDLESVLAEWRLFLEGNHHFQPSGPVLERMRRVVTKSSALLRSDSGANESTAARATSVTQEPYPSCGALFRNERGLAIAWGRDRAFPAPPPEFDVAAHSPDEYPNSLPGTTAHCVSFHQLYDELMSRASANDGVLGLVDYYPYWSQHAEHRGAGKVYPVLRRGDAPYQVFFDDNIFFGKDKSIVDLRCAETGAPLPLDTEATYSREVSPYLAIVDSNYFLNGVGHCVVAQAAMQAATRAVLSS